MAGNGECGSAAVTLLFVIGVGENAVVYGEFHNLPAINIIAFLVFGRFPVLRHSLDKVEDHVGEFE